MLLQCTAKAKLSTTNDGIWTCWMEDIVARRSRVRKRRKDSS